MDRVEWFLFSFLFSHGTFYHRDRQRNSAVGFVFITRSNLLSNWNYEFQTLAMLALGLKNLTFGRHTTIGLKPAIYHIVSSLPWVLHHCFRVIQTQPMEARRRKATWWGLSNLWQWREKVAMVIREDCEERRSLKLEAEKRERFDFERQRQAGPDKFFCLQAQFQSRLPTKFKTLLMFSLFNMLSRLSFIIHIWLLQASFLSFAPFLLFLFSYFFFFLFFLFSFPTILLFYFC